MRLISTLLLTLTLFSFGFAQEGKRYQVRTQLVTITNITAHQVFSPPVVISHGADFRAFQLGSPASEAIELLAESGNAMPLADMAAENEDVSGVVVVDGPLMPGHSVQVAIDAAPGDRISVLSMLVNTNDGFFASTIQVDTLPIFKNGNGFIPREYFANAYDAGTEINTESCDDVPGPGCGGAGEPEGEDVGFVHAHLGIHGTGDLDASVYDWRGPVATVSLALAPAGYEEGKQ